MAGQLNAEQKNIGEIFMKANFLVPDYQRSYSWEREQCEILWEDLKVFAFPNDTINDFDAKTDRYFMGTILTYRNAFRQDEIIDGQQRLITFLLMLRAFYQAAEKIEFPNKESVLSSIGQCIWNTDEFRNVDKTSLKLNSEVASDEDVAEFKKILATGEATEKNPSNYAINYRLFQRWIEEFKNDRPEFFSYLPMRILNNCILLPIEADNQNTALRIFTTLNDRGMPLSDSDIFKAQFYKFFSRDGKQSKELFVKRWKDLEELCNKNFHPRRGTPVDDLFMRYMYYLLAKSGTKNDTFVDMRDYYEKNNYAVLQSKKTFEDLLTLVEFWDEISKRDEKFSPRVLNRLYILNYAPYGIWVYIVSLYFLSNRELDDEKFYNFLNKITAMLFMHAITNPGTHSIRRPFFIEFGNILNGRPLEFNQFKMPEEIFRERLKHTKFSRSRPITRSMIAWFTFRDNAQELPPLGTILEVEHIYARKRNDFEPLENPDALEFLGNKTLLEKGINIRAADYRFEDKKKYYLGWQPKGKKYQPATFNLELRNLAETHDDFTEDDINERNEKIFNAFIEYLRENNLLI